MDNEEFFSFRQGKAPKQPPWRLWLMNSGLFIGALAVTIIGGTLLKSNLGVSTGKSNGAYYLQTTTALKPGDVINPDVAAWRSAYGKRSGAWITDASKSSTAYWGWRVVAPIPAGNPIPRASAVEGGSAASSIGLPPDMVGFVLSGDDLAASADMLKVGDHVSVIAVLDGPEGPSVATVVANARVVHVRRGVKRGGRGLDAAVTIAVTSEMAEELAVLRRAGTLDVTLATATTTGGESAGEWREIYETESDADVLTDGEDTGSSTGAEILQGGPDANASAGRKVTVVTPAGAQERDIP